MSRMIVAVGGTGQVVLLHYLRLFLLGVIKVPFRALVVDTDDVLPSILTIGRFLENLQYGAERTAALGEELPRIDVLRPNVGLGENLTEILTGKRSLADHDMHAARAFFSSETLKQDLVRGLFARPAMSSVLSQESLRTSDLRPALASTVVLVGSVIGGTGGGLMVPILEAIYRYQVSERIDDVKLRGVFFGQYFTPDSGRVEGDVQRFRANQLFVLKSMGEALGMLHSFHIVGGIGGTVERDPEEERRGVNYPWPPDSPHPFWQGVQALDFLLQESAKDRADDFKLREVDDINDSPDLDFARLRLSQAARVSQQLINRHVIRRICRENWLDTIWGSGLSDLITHYWKTAIRTEGREKALKDFPKQAQRSLEKMWNGSGQEDGLRTALPNPDEEGSTQPRNFRKIPWPLVEQAGSQDSRLFEGHGHSADRLAATLIFWMLRKGELR